MKLHFPKVGHQSRTLQLKLLSDIRLYFFKALLVITFTLSSDVVLVLCVAKNLAISASHSSGAALHF